MITAKKIQEIFEKKLQEKIQNQKIIFTKDKNERPHNGSSKEISDFLSKMQNEKFMEEEVKKASKRVAALAKEGKHV
ncbi:TPA: hypothetical protein ACHDSV_001557 [Campylobacter jejuni]